MLVRERPDASDTAWAALLARVNVEPLYLQLNGKPTLRQLVDERRGMWFHDVAGAYSCFHVGEALRRDASERPELAIDELYDEPCGERLRHVRVCRVVADSLDPQRDDVRLGGCTRTSAAEFAC